MTARTCPLCGAELAPGASIDSGCLRAARWRLRDVPPLLRELDVTISRQAGRGDGGAGGDRVDFDERAAAAAAALRDVLARWVAEWARSARILAADAPAFARMMATTTGHAALLATRELTGVAWAPRLAGELRDACDEAWQRVDRPPDTSFSGWCTAPEQAERTAAAERAEREREAERAHVRELQRTRAYADGERARLEAEQLAAERAHALALAQTHAERSPERPERSPRPPSARRAATRLDDVTARRREQVQGAWSAREHSDRPMTGPEVAQALGVSKGRARGIIADWRADQRRQQEAAR
jgi:hypothetical protein